MKFCRAVLLLLLCLGGIAPLQAAKPPEEPLVEKVRKAIEEGKRFLREQQVVHGEGKDSKGNWDDVDINGKGRRGGWTSLALLALLNAGDKPEAPVVQRALNYLRDIKPEDTYVVGLQTMVFVEAGQDQDLARIQRNVDWLINSRVMKGKELQGWGYKAGTNSTDNSNTQYALLGLWAGKVGGAKIEREVWESIRDYYVRTQEGSGGWYYISALRTPTLTMTTAGLCGLLISGLELNTGREIIQKNGTASNCGEYAENQPVIKATEWVTKGFTIEGVRHHLFYNLYGIERAGRLSGQRFFGDHDWYREGCQYLVKMQHLTGDAEHGAWFLRGQGFDTWPVISTSFALLFLSKGRTPVLISKLMHGPRDNPGTDWNNDRNDVRHLAEYASKQLFKRQPLAWQVFNIREAPPNNQEELLEKVGELLQSPIAYFNGHRKPIFTSSEKEMLKQYVEQGGFILAEACCGQKPFDAGFRELMKELFPDTPLTPLGPEHPIWQAHAQVPPGEFKLEGIELGCKTVVVYIPPQENGKSDLSCLWESNQFASGRGQLAFRLGANIVAYATGLEMPKPKGFQIDVVSDKPESKVPRGFFKVAQLRQGDKWRSAAQGLRNLMVDLRKNAGLDATLQTQDLFANDKDLVNYKFIYMHGRDDFEINEKDLELLKANLETGGLLFADACCGKKDFDKAFREFAAKLFPDKKLELIPLKDDLYSKELNGNEISSVRCRRERGDGQGAEAEYRNQAPQLEGIKVGNRWVLIYSKYDIGCALEKHQSSDCLGHDHDSALKLAGAAVLYSLQR